MKHADNEKGVILMVTLAIMAVLVVIVLEFNSQMLVQLDFTSTYRDDMKAYYLAKSGAHTAIALLMEDLLKEKDDYDSLDEPWGEINNNPLILEGGTATVTVTDENSKLNINYFVTNKNLENRFIDIKRLDGQGIFKRLLDLRNISTEEVDGIIDSTLDWLDADDKARVEGAEESYYNSLDPPIQIKNGLLHTISEINKIKNFSGDIVSKIGAGSTLYGNTDPAFLTYLTANSDGLININTAETELIQSLSDLLTVDDAADIINKREDEPFKAVLEVQNEIALANDKWNAIKDKLTVKSNYYSIISKGSVTINRSFESSVNIERVVKAIIKRNKKDSTITILYWKTE